MLEEGAPGARRSRAVTRRGLEKMVLMTALGANADEA